MNAITDREVLNTCNHLEMLRRPHLWPQSALPLKKPELLAKNYSDENGIGVLILECGAYKVYLKNLFMFALESSVNDPDYVYDSPEAVLADGWIVD
jgi:hypothetical protein